MDVSHVAVLVNADREHVAHGAEGAVFVVVCCDVLHLGGELSCPEKSLVNGLVSTPAARQHLAVCVALSVARALLLLLHEACVPVDSF